MAIRVIDAAEAWKSVSGGKDRQWADIADRFASDPFTVNPAPGFSLSMDHSFFCLGSCFARNIEEHLIYRGARVLSKRVVSPREEWPARTNGFLNKFTTHSMLQELRWLDSPPADPLAHLIETAQGWRDLHLTPGLQAHSLQRALARRRYLAEDYFPRLRQADVVVMTLGLNEVWRDNLVGTRLNAAPGLWEVRKAKGRFALEVTDVEQNVTALEEIRERLKALNPGVRIIVTVSPVPMGTTFSGRDVVIANMLSKSTLRAAADAFQQRHDDVDYFPSYEIVSLSSRPFAYAPDCLHVADRVVAGVMDQFFGAYFGEAAPRIAPDDFTELAYLDANPDVEDAVRRGELGSGFQHWQLAGQQEGRLLKPETQSARSVRAGL